MMVTRVVAGIVVGIVTGIVIVIAMTVMMVVIATVKTKNSWEYHLFFFLVALAAAVTRTLKELPRKLRQKTRFHCTIQQESLFQILISLFDD
jgi:hypothetical protein